MADKQNDDARSGRKGFGDDQGTRVGSPTPASDKDSARTTGAGAEATEGIHSADGSRDESDRSALEGKDTGRDDSSDGRAGSEPITSHDHEHQSKYGGGGRSQP